MREAIDKSLTMSTNPKTFTYIMRRLGYVIDLNPYHKYATIRSVNSKKATRLYRLGEDYDRENIYDRMRDTSQNHWQEAYCYSYTMNVAEKVDRQKDYGITIQKSIFGERKFENRKENHRA